MLVIEVKIGTNNKAIFTIYQQPKEDREILFKQHIKYTDLNKDLTFWAINETSDNYDPEARTVLMLPEEY